MKNDQRKRRPTITRAGIIRVKAQTELKRLVEEITQVPMKQVGANQYRTLCPLPGHQEETPSFNIYDNRRFRCYGCGKHGDALDFLRETKGMSFHEAYRYLGGDYENLSPWERELQHARQRHRQELMEHYRQWTVDKSNELGLLIRAAEKAVTAIRDEAALNKYGGIYDKLEVWRYWFHDILINGTDEERYDLYRLDWPSGKKKPDFGNRPFNLAEALEIDFPYRDVPLGKGVPK